MTISINPVITTNAAGTFTVTLDGLMQGMAMDDPAIRFQLAGGQLAATETLPMFGGIPIAEYLPPTGVTTDPSLQNSIQRATAAFGAAGGPTGISVFNQNHAMINSPQSPVPQASNGMLVNFFRFGSRARIAMALDPAFIPVVAAPGLPISTTPLNYNTNPTGGFITSATGAGIIALPASINILGYNLGNSMIVAYNAATGFATWVRNGNAILLEI